MPYSQPIRPEDDTIVLQLRDAQGTVIKEVTNFREYSFNSHFLTPTDHFSFVIGDEALKKSVLEGIFVGQQVTLQVSNYVQAGGFIDRVKIKTSRGGGTEVHIEGRDWMSPAVDANMDPERTKFQAGQTLEDVIKACFAPYGFGGIGQIVISDEANANIITGQHRGSGTSKTGKPLKSFQIHQLKPYAHEGVFTFASRLSQRFGLWIWPSADGQSLIVDVPDFDQKAIYNIFHKQGATNYLEGEIDANAEAQPTIIVATGFGGGGEYPRSGMKVVMVNEVTGLDAKGAIRADVQTVITQNADAKLLALRSGFAVRMPNARVRAVYLHDDESKTVQQLEDFVRREMALRQQASVVVHYTFEGHTLMGIPWYTNSVAHVDDDALEIHGRMWCISRSFTKSRGGGTHASVEFIMPNTMSFGE